MSIPAPKIRRRTHAKKSEGGRMALSNFSLLAAYNKSVNKKMNEVIGALTDEQWNKEILTFFKSIHALCSHVYIADFNWLRRFSARRDFAALHDPCFETG
jgi:uncharacterized damage-inducible protein DinB